ncbi:hypothetical protein WA026_023239 [Henosepilachna vigintioctopunctata]|uniref:C2H2-type domain-containing protein n=1 Tax=Henosepilachna vigintioctopunctata TaxID=420089 RepID=A0AAW1VG36_9CUCU
MDAFPCENCDRRYRYQRSLNTHRKYECGKFPEFKCRLCEYSAKLKGNLKKHLIRMHQMGESAATREILKAFANC